MNEKTLPLASPGQADDIDTYFKDIAEREKTRATASKIAKRRGGYAVRGGRMGRGFIIECPMPRHPSESPHGALIKDTLRGVKICCLEGHRPRDLIAALKAAGDL
jgi:hypothetical protein